MSEPDEPRPDFHKNADLLETLARLDAELALIDMPSRNASRSEATKLRKGTSRKEVSRRLKSNMIRQIVSKPGAESEFHVPTSKIELFARIVEIRAEEDGILRRRTVDGKQRELTANLEAGNISLRSHIAANKKQ